MNIKTYPDFALKLDLALGTKSGIFHHDRQRYADGVTDMLRKYEEIILDTNYADYADFTTWNAHKKECVICKHLMYEVLLSKKRIRVIRVICVLEIYFVKSTPAAFNPFANNLAFSSAPFFDVCV